MKERKKIVVGAWKAYLNKAEAEKTATALTEWRNNNDKKFDYDIVLSPSFPYLVSIQNIISKSDIALSAQDVDTVEMGAYTGHIPPEMLLDVGCKYVILGHSELRHRKEGLKMGLGIIHSKVKAALGFRLKVILCVGETIEHRNSKQTFTILTNQIKSALEGINENIVRDNLNIAYEPVWAISSQKPVSPPTSKEINETSQKIRSMIEKYLSKEVADTVRILYGGSVNTENVCSYLNEDNIDGVLVGGASKESSSFINLLTAVEKKVSLPLIQ